MDMPSIYDRALGLPWAKMRREDGFHVGTLFKNKMVEQPRMCTAAA
jgi:hypothetical protein